MDEIEIIGSVLPKIQDLDVVSESTEEGKIDCCVSIVLPANQYTEWMGAIKKSLPEAKNGRDFRAIVATAGLKMRIDYRALNEDGVKFLWAMAQTLQKPTLDEPQKQIENAA